MDVPASRRLLLRATIVAILATIAAGAQALTVCTITVNTSDEKEAFRRHLPAGSTRFVELLGPDRANGLGAACAAAPPCDVLVVSGHYDDDDDVFYSERIAGRETLSVDELEAMSCSESCPALFARLKEVYLFGCNTLNSGGPPEDVPSMVRGLVEEGVGEAQARRQVEQLAATHGASSRDRMRRVFEGVPAIYGFRGAAPPGPIAARTLERYFASAGAREVGQGHPSQRLLLAFEAFGLSSASGITDQDDLARGRRVSCRFSDERLGVAQRLAFIHRLLRARVPIARLYLERLQRFIATVDERARADPDVAGALEAIRQDDEARDRYLRFAREAEPPATGARMLDFARDLGWLTPEQHRAELSRMVLQLPGHRAIGVEEVELACGIGGGDGATPAAAAEADAAPDPSPAGGLADAALRACLGSVADHRRMLAAAASPRIDDQRIEAAYLRARPLATPEELRTFVAKVARMPPSDAQVLAIATLGRQYLDDRVALDRLAELYGRTSSPAVQDAVAGALLRADLGELDRPALLRIVQERRLSPAGAPGAIDALIRTLSRPRD